MGEVIAQHGSSPSHQAQAEFYAKLARLEHEVRTGKHPRITLPPSVIEALAALDSPAAELSVPNAAAVSANGIASTETASTTPAKSSLPAPITHKLPPKPANALQPLETKPFSPAFDPVLLTKSDQLLRAETALKRQKIERSLKNTAEARRAASRDKDWGAWTGSHLFDASEVLAQANALLKPLSGLRLPSANKPSPKSVDSFDENAYYSSRHNSWSSEKGENAGDETSPKQILAQREKDVDKTTDESVIDKPTALPARVSGLGPSVVPRPGSAPYAHADKPIVNSQPSAEKTDASSNEADEGEEELQSMRYESYSPPPADAFNNAAAQLTNNPSTASDSPSRNLESNALDSTSEMPAERVRDSESYSPPPPAFTSLQIPYHPQHSFQSPHVDSAQTGAQQNKNGSGRNGANNMTRSERKKQRQKNRDAKKTSSQSQSHAAKPNREAQNGDVVAHDQQESSHARKRRREGETDESPRRVPVPGALPQAPSPLPYIKQEPVSPPPARFSHEPSRRLVLHDDGRADIENLAPQPQTRQSRPVNAGFATEPMSRRSSLLGDRRYFDADTIYVDSPEASLPPPRRLVARDTMELRRVASLQNASRPMTAAAPRPRYYRPDDIQYVQEQDPSVYQDTYPPRQYTWEEEIIPRPISSAPTAYRTRDSQHQEYYTIEDTSNRMMPPPSKRRIIVDEHGNEYIAVPARSASIRVPEMSDMSASYGESRPMRALAQEAYYDTQSSPSSQQQQAYLINRQPSVIRRGPPPQQVIEIEDDDEDEYQRMPPPPPRLVSRKRVASSNASGAAPASVGPSPVPRPMSQYPNLAASNRSASLQPGMVMGTGTGHTGGGAAVGGREIRYREPPPIPQPMMPLMHANGYDGSAFYSQQPPQVFRSYSTRPTSQHARPMPLQSQQQYMPYEGTWR